MIFSKKYEPGDVEPRWYEQWLEWNCFEGNPSQEGEPYSIVIPPPNVTGILTMGHVLNNTIQDILARRARQEGKSVLWLPGTDHAGIATQTKVERSLREQGINRRDLGREKFLEKAWEWKEEHGGIILKQLRHLGSSCDWNRTVHTLDESYSKAVLSAFVKLFEKGYIYKGHRMVNWCPSSLTALSDEEVIMKPQSSKLYTVRYEIVEEPGTYVQVSTTRPETIMGDSAIAIHPEDERWPDLEGKHVRRPLNPAEIPIIADDVIEKDFGTGMLKVTPAHDKLDFEIGERHDLPVIDILNPDGTINPETAGPDFGDMDRFDARKASVKKLDEQGDLIEIEEHENNVGFSERADVPIEPRLSDQWFLRYPRVEEAKAVVREKFIRFHPERWVKTYLHWLDNIKDWCISRQLWWGHRIPVWYRKDSDRKDPTNIHVSVEGPEDSENWEQDEDVLDTWASSWLWPLATMGWPDKEEMEKKGLNTFYPTSALVTGPDIIFFWVARMIMAGLEFHIPGTDNGNSPLTTDEMRAALPFRDVYFTGIIRDIEGRKMSKSLGNSPDPLDLIAKYGADGLRFGIMSIAPTGLDIRFDETRVETGRNFCTKLWNVCRFRQMSGELGDNSTLTSILERIDPSHLDTDDHAILTQLIRTQDRIFNAYGEFQFNAVAQSLYTFIWNDLCDWYVEVSKTKLQNPAQKENCLAIQDLCLRQSLIMLHPFTPFITEELWYHLHFNPNWESEPTREGSIQYIDQGDGESLNQALEGKGIKLDGKALDEIAKIRETVTNVRALKAQFNLATNNKVALQYESDEASQAILETHKDKLLRIIGACDLIPRDVDDTTPATVTPLGTIHLDLGSAVDKEAETARLTKELAKLDKIIISAAARLSNEAFLAKAPDNVIEGARSQLAENKKDRQETQKLLDALK
ncbi:MAG: valine--tRNA ligase [Opitutae bacterium]|nr:valine--tRNA ligase [Opitutae bacterium]